MNNEEIQTILLEAVDIERWVPKSNSTYTFIDESEREEMVKNILEHLKEKGYKIIKDK
jgi:2C-methyl-D-erythritol 2,4-cyclodiphosphate synthase